MRVLQINAVYEKYSTGRTTKELHEAMIANGIESYVACSDISSLRENCYKIGCRLDYKLHAVFSRVFGKQGYYSKVATRGLLKYIDSIEPDIVHLRNLHSNFVNVPLLLSYLAEREIATVITLHDSWLYTGKCVYYIEVGCNRWLDECGCCPALKQGNPSLFIDASKEMLKDKERLFSSIRRLAVIGVSQWVTSDVRKSILKNASIIKCIYNWIDLDLFRPRDSREIKRELGFEGKTVVLGIAASWNEQKGIVIFNRLANMLPENYQIVLVGDSSNIDVRNSKICYAGTILDTERLSMYYSMADVFVNPSIQETFGKTTAEALSSGIPVVAFNSTATPELIGTDGRCGYLISNNDPNEYLECILKLQNQDSIAMRTNTRKRAESLFSKEQNIAEYLEVYKALYCMNGDQNNACASII